MRLFQNESLKIVVHRLLKVLPATSGVRNELYIPGELGQLRLVTPTKLLVCGANGAEAWSVARELVSLARDGLQLVDATELLQNCAVGGGADEPSASKSRRPSSLSLPELSSARPVPDVQRLSPNTYLLVYLNAHSFCDGDIDDEGSLAYTVRSFMRRVRQRHIRVPLHDRLCPLASVLSWPLHLFVCLLCLLRVLPSRNPAVCRRRGGATSVWSSSTSRTRARAPARSANSSSRRQMCCKSGTSC